MIETIKDPAWRDLSDVSVFSVLTYAFTQKRFVNPCGKTCAQKRSEPIHKMSCPRVI